MDHVMDDEEVRRRITRGVQEYLSDRLDYDSPPHAGFLEEDVVGIVEGVIDSLNDPRHVDDIDPGPAPTTEEMHRIRLEQLAQRAAAQRHLSLGNVKRMFESAEWLVLACVEDGPAGKVVQLALEMHSPR